MGWAAGSEAQPKRRFKQTVTSCIRTVIHLPKKPRPVLATKQQPGTRVQGWRGHNERFNGEYTHTGETVNDKPVFRHLTTSGGGAGDDWCRMYYAHGPWLFLFYFVRSIRCWKPPTHPGRALFDHFIKGVWVGVGWGGGPHQPENKNYNT